MGVAAAIATAFALNAAEPFASGIGGGGFRVIHLAREKKVTVINFREKAPAKASPSMYWDKGKIQNAWRKSFRIPGNRPPIFMMDFRMSRVTPTGNWTWPKHSSVLSLTVGVIFMRERSPEKSSNSGCLWMRPPKRRVFSPIPLKELPKVFLSNLEFLHTYSVL